MARAFSFRREPLRCHAEGGWNGNALCREPAPGGRRGPIARIPTVDSVTQVICRRYGERASKSRDDHVSVMLHLRSLYVSKAAILTTPMLPRCRSKIEVPLEFQGLGSIGAAHGGDGSSLASLIAKRARLWLQKIRLFRECPAVMLRPCSSWPAMKNPSTRSKPISTDSRPY
jgi:hypothetical protein